MRAQAFLPIKRESRTMGIFIQNNGATSASHIHSGLYNGAARDNVQLQR